MAQQCERPTCAEPAMVAYGFDPGRGVAWLETFAAGHPHQGRLCLRHADAMIVPQGWWLEDRRSTDRLFSTGPAPAGSDPYRRPRRPECPTGQVVPLPLPNLPPLTEIPAAEVAIEPAAAVVADATVRGDDTADQPVPSWTPTFVVDDDLDGLLNASSPLLSRAFGRVKASGTRQRAPGA